MLLASFDIGKRNFSFAIESFNSVPKYDNSLPLRKRYNENGTCTPEFQKILGSIYQSGEVVVCEKYDLLLHHDDVICGLYDVMDKYTRYWDMTSYFIVEKQLKKNPTAVKIQYALMGYLRYRYGTFKFVIEFPAYNKGNILGAEKAKNSRKRKGLKPWAVREMKVILKCKKQDKLLDEIMSYKKRDDYADALCQLQAFKFLHFI